eukprot:1390682-Pyramimonas_sp.AAC.1
MNADLVQGDLGATETLDRVCGFVENVSKRQLRGAANGPPAAVEHLGIKARPTDADSPILPRLGWAKVYRAVEALGCITDGSDVRERLAVVC